MVRLVGVVVFIGLLVVLKLCISRVFLVHLGQILVVLSQLWIFL